MSTQDIIRICVVASVVALVAAPIVFISLTLLGVEGVARTAVVAGATGAACTSASLVSVSRRKAGA